MYPRKKYRTIWVKDEGSWAGLGPRARHATGVGATGVGLSATIVTPITAPSSVLIVTNLSYEPVGQIVTI